MLRLSSQYGTSGLPPTYVAGTNIEQYPAGEFTTSRVR
jgi:hypothetical protein